MKVYAVIENCPCGDYSIIDDCLYLKEEDAKEKLNEVTKKYRWPEAFKILEFEVKE